MGSIQASKDSNYEQSKENIIVCRNQLVEILKNEFGDVLKSEIAEFIAATDKNFDALDSYNKTTSAFRKTDVAHVVDNKQLITSIKLTNDIIDELMLELSEYLSQTSKSTSPQSNEAIKDIKSIEKLKHALEASIVTIDNSTEVLSGFAFGRFAEKNTMRPATGRVH